jgi:hypothetical protein
MGGSSTDPARFQALNTTSHPNARKLDAAVFKLGQRAVSGLDSIAIPTRSAVLISAAQR